MTKKQSKTSREQKKREQHNKNLKNQKKQRKQQEKIQKEKQQQLELQQKELQIQEQEKKHQEKQRMEEQKKQLAITEKSNNMKNLLLSVITLIRSMFPTYLTEVLYNKILINVCQHIYFSSIKPIFRCKFNFRYIVESITSFNYWIYLSTKEHGIYYTLKYYLGKNNVNAVNYILDNFDIKPDFLLNIIRRLKKNNSDKDLFFTVDDSFLKSETSLKMKLTLDSFLATANSSDEVKNPPEVEKYLGNNSLLKQYTKKVSKTKIYSGISCMFELYDSDFETNFEPEPVNVSIFSDVSSEIIENSSFSQKDIEKVNFSEEIVGNVDLSTLNAIIYELNSFKALNEYSNPVIFRIYNVLLTFLHTKLSSRDFINILSSIIRNQRINSGKRFSYSDDEFFEYLLISWKENILPIFPEARNVIVRYWLEKSETESRYERSFSLNGMFILLNHELLDMKNDVVTAKHIVTYLQKCFRDNYYHSHQLLIKLQEYKFFDYLSRDDLLFFLQNSNIQLFEFLFFRLQSENFNYRESSDLKRSSEKLLNPGWDCPILYSACVYQLNDEQFESILKTEPNLELSNQKFKDFEITPLLNLCCYSRKTYSTGNSPDFHLLTKIEMLLEKGVNVNYMNSIGLTPLKAAVLNHHYELVELLLKYGANPLDDLSNEKIKINSESGNEFIKKCFEENVPYPVEMNYGIISLNFSSDYQKKVSLPINLLNRMSCPDSQEYKNSYYEYRKKSAINFRESSLMLICKMNIDVNGLRDIPYYAHETLKKKIDLENVKMKIIAIKWNIIKLLVENGADINYMNSIGETIISVVIKSIYPQEITDHCNEISDVDYQNILFLLERGIELDYSIPKIDIIHKKSSYSYYGYSTYDRNLSLKEMQDIHYNKYNLMLNFIEKMRNCKGNWINLLVKLFQHGANVETTNTEGNSLFMLYCMKYHLFFEEDVAYLFIHYGADPMRKNLKGETIFTNKYMMKNTVDSWRGNLNVNLENVNMKLSHHLISHMNWLNPKDIEVKRRIDEINAKNEEFRKNREKYGYLSSSDDDYYCDDSDDYDYY